jgi:hypothetical protein
MQYGKSVSQCFVITCYVEIWYFESELVNKVLIFIL